MPWQSPGQPGTALPTCSALSSPSLLQTHPLTAHRCQLWFPGMQLSCSRCKSTVWLECLSGLVLEWLMLSPIFPSLLNELLLGMVSEIDVAI